jgi:hypothetical protein
METVINVVGYILAISIAAERLVEIIKGVIPWLGQPKTDENLEAKRHSALQILAVASGIATAALGKDLAPAALAEISNGMGIICLGLLASGGSGFWNAILTYILQVKDIKKVEADKAKENAVKINV